MSINLPERLLYQSFFTNKDLDLNGWFLLKETIKIGKTELDGHATCNSKIYVYLTNGVLHKMNGPAVVYEKDSLGYLVKYYQDNVLYNPNGPSIFRVDLPWCFDGINFLINPESKLLSEYYTNSYGVCHRVEGAARISKLNKENEYEYYYEGTKYLKRAFITLPEVVEYNKKKSIKDKMINNFGDNK